MADLAALVAARYGGSAPAEHGAASVAVNHTLATLLSHRSVRHFQSSQPLPAGSLEVLVAAAQSAPTSSNLHAWSVVAVQDREKRAKLAELSGSQRFVRDAPLVLVFVADLHRAEAASAAAAASADNATDGTASALVYTEMFLVASLDAAFAAQNALVAAESLGLGACYVGAARNRPREVAALLGLPPRVIALFGLAIGVPDKAQSTAAEGTPVKPRLPPGEVLHREVWDDAHQQEHFVHYDATLAAYNQTAQRNGNSGSGNVVTQPVWTARTAARVATAASLHGRHELRQILQERGFELQ